MDDQRVGSALRTIRLRRDLRQADLSRMAGVSRTTISRLERGHVAAFTLETIRAVAKALDVRMDLTPRWRAGDLDRLLNSRHSGLHELVARSFRDLPGWVAEPEVSFAIFGERGVIDILAWHPGRRMLLVIELKTDIADINELVGTVDRKRRLAVEIAIDRGMIPAGGAPSTVSTWVIVADGHTNRRRVQTHGSMLRAAFPSDGRSMAGWLQNPARPIRALSFWPNLRRQNVSGSRTPVRRVSARARRAA
jgi:transcriptional regulator with XRE-family HTH domain